MNLKLIRQSLSVANPMYLINGDNFHIYKISDVNRLATNKFLDKLKKVYKEYPIHQS